MPIVITVGGEQEPVHRLVSGLLAAALAATPLVAAAAPAQSSCRPKVARIALPDDFRAGETAVGRVRLTCAPGADLVVRVSENSGHVEIPASVVVRAGRRSTPFTMTADTHYSPSYVAKVTARRNRSSLTARLTVAPGLNVIQVPVGDRPNDVGLQVHFTGPLPEPGGTVAVRSDDPAVSVPATHTFQGGATGGGVPGITVQPVTEETEVALSVTYGRRTLATTTTLVPPADPYDVSATLVAQNARETEYGGTRSGQYDVWLDAPAPPGGLEFAWRIRDEDPVATLDTSPYGHVPGGGTKAAARLLLAPVASTHVVVLEAAFGDRVFELPITIEPRPTDLVLPDSVVGGDTFTGSVVTAGPASVDTVVELVAFGPVDLPARVVVRAGETAASFTGTTFSVEEERVVTVHGSFGAGHSLETAYTTVVP